MYSGAASPRGRKAGKPEKDGKEGSREKRREAKNTRTPGSSRSGKEEREPTLTYEKTQEQLIMEEAMR